VDQDARKRWTRLKYLDRAWVRGFVDCTRFENASLGTAFMLRLHALVRRRYKSYVNPHQLGPAAGESGSETPYQAKLAGKHDMAEW
jgi:hypothetical protein